MQSGFRLSGLGVVLLSGMIFFSIAAYTADNPFHFPHDSLSASYSEDAFSSILNPVFSDFSYHSYLAYKFMSYENLNESNHFIMGNFLGFSFIYCRYNELDLDNSSSAPFTDANFYHINKGFFIQNTFGLGVGYSFSRSDNSSYNDYRSWTFGFLYRPFKYVSLGISLRDLWAKISGESIKRNEIYSISLRPYTDRITLSFDAARESGQNFSEMDYTVSAETRLFYDISLFFKYNINNNFIFGLSIPFFIRGFNSSSIILDSSISGSRNDMPGWYSFGISIPGERYRSAALISRGDNMLMIRFNKKIKENETINFFRTRSIVFSDILNAIMRAGKDKSIDGIILQIDYAGLGFAQVQELRSELKKFRSRGKKVYSIVTTPGNREYYLASVADKIYFAPNSSFYLSGLSAEVYFFKGLLDLVGVKYESIKKGKYKSFNESFTRTGMSNEFRENFVSLLSDLNKQFINDIANDRNIPKTGIEKLINMGGITPDEAQQGRLVDKVMYVDEALKDIAKNLTVVQLHSYLSENEKIFSWGPIPAVAIIYLNGSIVRGKSFGSRYMDTIGDDTYQKMLERVFKDRTVKAVVIRVNSGGGSAVASDFMWNSLLKMKKKYKKPVVFSFGNIAASGGYYAACTGDKIFTSRGSLTGSIGVIFGKISLMGLYKKLGINKDVIKMSEFADIFSESRDLNEKERKILQRGVDFIYDRFTGKVIQARGIEKDRISDVAEGKIFSGNQAKNNRLADQIGGLITAVEYARSIGKIPDEYRIIELPDQMTYFVDLLGTSEGWIFSRYLEMMFKNIDMINFKNETALYLFPYRIEIK